MSNQVISDLIKTLCRTDLRAWFQSYCTIKKKGGAFVEGARMHEYQEKMEEVQRWCRENKRPCRIVAVKPRRAGSSTFAIASMYHYLMYNPGKYGCVMAGSDYQGENLFAMLKLMAKEDRVPKNKAVVLDKNARFSNGSTAVRINASNENAGLSGGYDFLLVTELSKWAEDGVAAAPEVLSGALKCVPYLPDTTIIIESTAEGYDELQRIYSTGVTFEEFKAGKTGYIRVFSPWFEFKDHILDPSEMGLSSTESYTTAETDLVAKYSLTLQQVSWMRYTIKDQCKGDFDNFKENYPFNDIECFLLSGRRAFSITGIEKMKSDCSKFPFATGKLDYIKGSENAVIWRPSPAKECQVLRWEQPQEGMKYLLSVDPMTGASQVAGEDPDNHFAVIWRAGYFNRGQWCAPRIVAHLIDDFELWMTKREYALRWDIDVLAEQAWRLATYYGNCIMVPEMNMDRGLVELWKLKPAANIFMRQFFNRREQVETNAYGWLTTPETRGKIITELQTGIREYANIDPVKGWSQDRCEIYSPMILDELETCIVKTSGKCEAMQGKHDDGILAAGIGLVTIDSATVYHRPQGRAQGDMFGTDDQPGRVGTYA